MTAPAISDIAEPLRAVPGGMGGAPLNPVVEFEYDRVLDSSTVNASNITLSEGSTSSSVPASVMLRGDHTSRVMPAAPLKPDTLYTVEVSSDMQDGTGRHARPIRQTLTTGAERNWGAPRLLSVTPPQDATDVVPAAEIRLLYDRPMNSLTLSPDTVWLGQDGTPVAVVISLANDGREVILTTVSQFQDSGQVQLTISGVEDPSGNTAVSATIRFQVRASRQLARAQFKKDAQPGRRPVFAVHGAIEVLIGRR